MDLRHNVGSCSLYTKLNFKLGLDSAKMKLLAILAVAIVGVSRVIDARQVSVGGQILELPTEVGGLSVDERSVVAAGMDLLAFGEILTNQLTASGVVTPDMTRAATIQLLDLVALGVKTYQPYSSIGSFFTASVFDALENASQAMGISLSTLPDVRGLNAEQAAVLEATRDVLAAAEVLLASGASVQDLLVLAENLDASMPMIANLLLIAVQRFQPATEAGMALAANILAVLQSALASAGVDTGSLTSQASSQISSVSPVPVDISLLPSSQQALVAAINDVMTAAELLLSTDEVQGLADDANVRAVLAIVAASLQDFQPKSQIGDALRTSALLGLAFLTELASGQRNISGIMA